MIRSSQLKVLTALKKELNTAKVDWQMNYYSGAVHAFTQPMAGSDNSKGAAYNKEADKRSWTAMQSFFDEIFAKRFVLQGDDATRLSQLKSFFSGSSWNLVASSNQHFQCRPAKFSENLF